MVNRLAGEKSPYLLQHAANPVDWYPWGPEALERARRDDRPILVSIGYSACHWCHVMAHESFEDVHAADLMNNNFVNIKVDREERPDVDAIYMEAVQAMTGQGGWPLNVFLTSDGKPFFGGTYFPPEPRHGMPGWTQILGSVADAYRTRRDDVVHNASILTDAIAQAQSRASSSEAVSTGMLQSAYEAVIPHLDDRHGGFGGAPKFPQPLALEWMLRMAQRFDAPEARTAVELTLSNMAAGGIHDQLGGGFHRYTVDDHWLVPHFEKMLYDNALLARVYLQAFQFTGNQSYREVVELTLDYLLRELRGPEGGFYCAQDADSEGEEGKYYVWTVEEIESILGDDARPILQHFGVTSAGNFEGKTILTAARRPVEVAGNLGMSEPEVLQALARGRTLMLRARNHRVAPGTDTKMLAGWNGLAIRALAEAGRVLHRPDYLQAATEAMEFVLTQMCPDGKMVRSYLDGPSVISAFLEDFAFLTEALLTLYETVFDARYLHSARRLADEMIERFAGPDGAFFDTADDAERLVVRPRGLFDNPIPSGNSSAAFALLRLESLLGEARYGAHARAVFAAARSVVDQAPLAFSYLLSALDFYLSTSAQIGIVGDADSEATLDLVDEVYARYLPNKVVAVGTGDETPLLAGRNTAGAPPTAYVCEHFSCRLPVHTAAELRKELDAI